MSKKVCILGGGESGVGAALLAKKKGFEVVVSDAGKIKKQTKDVLCRNEIKWEEQKHSFAYILSADEVIKSPGIPNNAAIIKKIKEANIPVISEIEFAGRYFKGVTIGVTGSNGKTTTCSLIWHILNKAGINAGLGGNIGKSFARQLAEDKAKDVFVLELSSFQLEDMYDFKADIAIITNITPDHLDRYENDFSKYVAAKLRILQNQSGEDALIYCADDPVTESEIQKQSPKASLFPYSLNKRTEKGAYISKDSINITTTMEEEIISIQSLALQGKHNTYNSMAAGIAGKLLEIRKSTIKESLSDFQGIEHRLEYVLNIQGIEFINDSKATNVNSTWYALESMKKEVIWIAGGVDKGNDYSFLDELVAQKVKAIVCIGTDNSKIMAHFSKFDIQILNTDSMAMATLKAYQLATKGDAVLLSPACASFDLFDNYEERGREFKQAVRDL